MAGLIQIELQAKRRTLSSGREDSSFRSKTVRSFALMHSLIQIAHVRSRILCSSCSCYELLGYVAVYLSSVQTHTELESFEIWRNYLANDGGWFWQC